MLREFSPRGELIRNITLQSDISIRGMPFSWTTIGTLLYTVPVIALIECVLSTEMERSLSRMEETEDRRRTTGYTVSNVDIRVDQ
jgi:hypothetical protein